MWKKKVKAKETEHVKGRMERNEVEQLFLDCVEQVRKEVLKRKVRAELRGIRKYIPSQQKEAMKESLKESAKREIQMDKAANNDKEFEDSLLKLKMYAREKIKYSDFTLQDRYNILDMFVNNENTLIAVYEALFPDKKKKEENNWSAKDHIS